MNKTELNGQLETAMIVDVVNLNAMSDVWWFFVSWTALRFERCRTDYFLYRSSQEVEWSSRLFPGTLKLV